MSYVANTILTFGVLEDAKLRLAEVNKFFDDDCKGFVDCNDESLPIGWYGGSKMLETNICIGAFNYLKVDELIEHLREIKWEEPKNVQLIIQNQNDEKFAIKEL